MIALYELVREIKNLCRNNQMRDVFFEEVACDDPVEYVKSVLKGTDVQVTAQTDGDEVTIHAVCDVLIQKFVFTRI